MILVFSRFQICKYVSVFVHQLPRRILYYGPNNKQRQTICSWCKACLFFFLSPVLVWQQQSVIQWTMTSQWHERIESVSPVLCVFLIKIYQMYNNWKSSSRQISFFWVFLWTVLLLTYPHACAIRFWWCVSLFVCACVDVYV